MATNNSINNTLLTTAYAPICGGTTAAGVVQAASSGQTNSGYVLTSTGASSLPTWQATAGGGVTSLAGTTNQVTASASTGAVTLSIPSTFIAPGSIAATTTVTATLGNVTITSGNLAITAATTSSVGQVTQAGNRLIHTYGGDGAGDDTNSNLFVGQLSGNFTLKVAANFGGNVGFGYNTLLSLDGGTENLAIGNKALKLLTGANNGSSGYRNTAVGTGALALALTSRYCVALGYHAGAALTSSENSDIYINNSGVVAESNCLRIGAGAGTGEGQLNKAIIYGIYNTAVGSTSNVTLVDSAGQLGGLAGSANTVLMGGTAPSFTGSPSFSGSVTAGTTITATGLSTTGIVQNSSAGLLSTYAATNHTVQIGNSSGQLVSIANGTTNQVLVAQTGADPIWAAVPATAGVTALAGTANQITASASTGSITLSIPSTFTAPGTIASTTSLTAGSGFTVTTGATTINSGTSAINIGTDAAAKIITIGTTTTTTAVNINTGTGDWTLASATGTLMKANDTGEIVTPLQPTFQAYVATTINNVTGDGTVYTIIFDTETFDLGNNFNLGTSTFTAPVTGKYFFQYSVLCLGGTVINAANARIVTTARTYNNSAPLSPGTTAACSMNMSVIADMTAADTATFTIATTDTGGKIDDISGTTSGNLRTFVSGRLLS